MVKKMIKYGKFLLSVTLICSLVAPSYAALSATDGSAFVTKAEFDSALADFNARLTTFEAGINSKIDSQVTSFLDKNGIWNGKVQTIYNKWPSTRVNLLFKDGYNIEATQKNTSFFNYFWWGEIYTPDPATLASQTLTGWNHRWSHVDIATNDMGCFDSRDPNIILEEGLEKGLWLQPDTIGPYYESQIRNGYSDVLYFIPNKSGLAHIQYQTNPIFNNGNFDVIFWGTKQTAFMSYNGNLNEAAIIKEWHLRGFKDYEIDTTTKKIIKPEVTDNPLTDFTLSVHNVPLRLDRNKPVYDKIYKQGSTTTQDNGKQIGNGVAMTLLQMPAYNQHISNFSFVNKDWLYTIEIYTGCYDQADRTHFANNQAPCITFKNTNPEIRIY